MEQFFEITKESKEYDNYFRYVNDENACREIVSKFFDDNKISIDRYSVYCGKLWILDNPTNREQFGLQLAKDSKNGLVAFKMVKPEIPLALDGRINSVRSNCYRLLERR